MSASNAPATGLAIAGSMLMSSALMVGMAWLLELTGVIWYVLLGVAIVDGLLGLYFLSRSFTGS